MNISNPTQFLLPLVQTIITERGHSLVCIPDRTTAEHEEAKLRRQYRARFIRADIRKVKLGKSGTYTLRYVTRETEEVRLF
jgi:hypothetical protein